MPSVVLLVALCGRDERCLRFGAPTIFSNFLSHELVVDETGIDAPRCWSTIYMLIFNFSTTDKPRSNRTAYVQLLRRKPVRCRGPCESRAHGALGTQRFYF